MTKKEIYVIGGLKEDSDNFKERAQKIIDQFSAFEPLDSLFINGELTQGENIADLRWINCFL